MGGYLTKGQGKSDRAYRAEAEGKFCATDFAKWLKKYIKGVTSADVKAVLYPCEWHHTSKYFNQTDYFDKRDMLELENRQEFRNRVLYRKLVKKAFKQGLTWFVMEDGRQWYPIPKAYSKTDLERLQALLSLV